MKQQRVKRMDKSRHRTYQCRITASGAEDAVLESYAALYGKAARTLFSRLKPGGNLADLKREFLRKFGMTARQFNALAFEIKGKIASIAGCDGKAGFSEEESGP